MRRITCILGTALLLMSVLAYSQPCGAQQTVHLFFLRIDGDDVEGESTQTSMEREGTTECMTYSDGLAVTGVVERTSRPVHEPIVFTKRLDQVSPLLWDALQRNKTVTGEFRFYRPNPAGDGSTEWFYTVEIEGAQVASIKTISRDRLDLLGEQNYPAYEEVTFVYRTITRTYRIGGGTTYQGGIGGPP